MASARRSQKAAVARRSGGGGGARNVKISLNAATSGGRSKRVTSSVRSVVVGAACLIEMTPARPHTRVRAEHSDRRRQTAICSGGGGRGERCAFGGSRHCCGRRRRPTISKQEVAWVAVRFCDRRRALDERSRLQIVRARAHFSGSPNAAVCRWPPPLLQLACRADADDERSAVAAATAVDAAKRRTCDRRAAQKSAVWRHRKFLRQRAAQKWRLVSGGGGRMQRQS